MKRQLLILLVMVVSINVDGFSQIEFSSPWDAVQVALENSQEHKILIQISKEKIKNAKLSIIPFLPSLNFHWTENNQIIKHNPDIHSKSINIELNQMIYDNGKSKLKYLSTKSSSDLDYLLALQTIREFSLSILEQYYNLLLQEETLKLKENLLSQTTNDYQIILFKFEKGLISKSEKLEYDISLRRLQNELNNSYSEYFLNKTNFSQLLNLPEAVQIKFNHDNKLLDDSILQFDGTNIVEKIVENNLELRQITDMIKYQSDQKKILNRFYIPSIYFSGGLNFLGTTYPLTQPQFTVRLSFKFEELPFLSPSFSEGAFIKEKRIDGLESSFNAQVIPQLNYFSNLRLSDMAIRQIQEKLISRVKEIKAESLRYINSCKNLIDNISLLEQEINLKNEKIDIYKYELEQGLIKQSDYLKEQLDLGETNQKLLQAKISLALLYNKIKFLAGEYL